MSAYTVGLLLYQAIHQKLPNQGHSVDLEIKPIPQIYQLLKICLSPIPEERFLLPQLLSLLVDIRKSMSTPKIYWDVHGRSTVGLSTNRLQNEDNYGVLRQDLSNSDPLTLGVVADGMGGMAQGEIASKLAVKTIIEAPIPADLTDRDKRAEWLISLVENANECVADNVRDGGTTLSVVLAIARELMIAHVGDSRIFLVRKKQICQLSEDHSMVSMLVASGKITYEESQVHPDRNILTKSLGSKRKLSDRYIQDLSFFGVGISMFLEDGDILLLCSDGVWDLVPADDLAEIFADNQTTLHLAVESTIEKVLARGAHDNATILALKCCVENSY
jgi:protein phosphatase